MHSTRPLVPIEKQSIYWYSIGERHLIMGTSNISDRFNLSRGAFYSSIGINGTSGIAVNPLVFHW